MRGERKRKGKMYPCSFSVNSSCVLSYFRHRLREEGKEDEDNTGRM